MKRILYSLLVLIVLSCSLRAQEYRAGVSVESHILPCLKGEAQFELRSIFYPGYYLNRTFQVELSYEFSQSWNLGAAYSYSYISKDDEFDNVNGDETSDRNKYMVNLEFNPKRYVNDLKISNRIRYQYSTVNGDQSKQYLRNKFTVDYKITSRMNPYMSIEPYYQLEKNKFNIVRFYLGNELPVWKSKIDIYYIAEVHLVPEQVNADYILGLMIELDWK